jgi:hypothetical protein
MKLTRTTALAALLFVAVAAPAGAFALAGDDGDSGTSHHATHHEEAKHDKAAKPKHTTGEEHADEASAPGRAHAEAMKAWAHCVADAASGPKTGEHTGPPKDACGDKPVGPGRAKHESAAPSHGPPAGKGPLQPHGKSQSHRS